MIVKQVSLFHFPPDKTMFAVKVTDLSWVDITVFIISILRIVITKPFLQL